MARVKMKPTKVVNYIVAHHDTTQHAIGTEQGVIQGRAVSRLEQHRDSGASRISTSEDAPDAYVTLEDPAAVSIEFGHFVKGKYETDTPKFVPGLYILTEASGLFD